MTGTKLQYRDVQIGEVPADWGKVKVDENLVQVLGGFSCARTKTVSAGIPHLRPMNVATNGEVVLTADTQYIRPDFRDDLESYHLRTGDILFNNTNSVELVGKTAIVREPMAVAFSNHINRLRVRDPNQIDPRWLALALRYLRDQGFFASHCNKWIGQAGFSVSELAKVDIPIPYPDDPTRSLETQRRIIARIEALFAELRKCRKLHQAVVEDTNRLMDSVLAEVFPDSTNGVPDGWFVRTVGEISSRPQYGYTQSARNEPVGPQFLRITDIQDGMVDWSSVPYCECNDAAFARYQLADGDIVFARSGATTGKTFLVKMPPDAVFASYLIRLRVANDVTPDFVWWFFQSPYYWKQIILRGGAQPNMNAQILKCIRVPIPTAPSLQSQIVARLDGARSEIREMQAVSNAATELLGDMEQAILAQAFRGEL